MYVKAYTSGLSRRYSRIAIVYSKQTETGKPYCNIEFLSNMASLLKPPIDKTSFTQSWEWGMGCLFMSVMWMFVINSLYVNVAVVYAASCCSHGLCYNEIARCRNIKYNSLARYPSLFDASAFRGSWNDHSINILPWHSFQVRVLKPIANVNFQAF